MISTLSFYIMKLLGWKYITEQPEYPSQFILTGAPHTSNWDFFPAMAIKYKLKGIGRFLIKKEWMVPPLGWFFKAAGALGIDREAIGKGEKTSTTDWMASLFKKYSNLILLVAPEGTRSPTANWKSGFYYTAEKANVPIVLGWVDYQKKEMGLGPIINPTNFDEDMRKIKEYYKGKAPCHPEKFLT